MQGGDVEVGHCFLLSLQQFQVAWEVACTCLPSGPLTLLPPPWGPTPATIQLPLQPPTPVSLPNLLHHPGMLVGGVTTPLRTSPLSLVVVEEEGLEASCLTEVLIPRPYDSAAPRAEAAPYFLPHTLWCQAWQLNDPFPPYLLVPGSPLVYLGQEEVGGGCTMELMSLMIGPPYLSSVLMPPPLLLLLLLGMLRLRLEMPEVPGGQEEG